MAPDSLICRIQKNYFAIIEKEDKKIEKKNPKSIKGEKLHNVHVLHCTYYWAGVIRVLVIKD